jgi:hypothetical protein
MKNPSDIDTITKELTAILLKKQQDYGPLNIALAPGGPMNGLRVRMYDKLARLNNLADKDDTPNYESIEDTLNRPSKLCHNRTISTKRTMGRCGLIK